MIGRWDRPLVVNGSLTGQSHRPLVVKELRNYYFFPKLGILGIHLKGGENENNHISYAVKVNSFTTSGRWDRPMRLPLTTSGRSHRPIIKMLFYFDKNEIILKKSINKKIHKENRLICFIWGRWHAIKLKIIPLILYNDHLFV